jgi:aminoglycoside phosphotransferase (APT) family kinase protein
MSSDRSGTPPAADVPPAADAARTGLEGIDADRVTGWFVAHVPDVTPPLRFVLIAGGRSNLTFRVEDAAGRTFALRRPPVSHVLPTAHDMAREHRLISALGPTDVPVPAALGLCTDEAVIGAPFHVMQFVTGHVLRDEEDARGIEPALRAVIGDRLAETLAALHAVDVDAVGLGDLARHDGYVERQLRRWTQQYRDTQVEGVDHGGLVEKVGADLAARIPAAQRVSVVHGDYRLDNVVLGDDGRVKAILDWEICTLGDPMADVGLLQCFWSEPGEEPALLVAPTLVSGFCPRAQVLERYAAASGADVSEIGFYMAFGYWKLACILQGVYARYVAGAGAGDSSSVEEYPRQIGWLASMAADTLARR